MTGADDDVDGRVVVVMMAVAVWRVDGGDLVGEPSPVWLHVWRVAKIECRALVLKKGVGQRARCLASRNLARAAWPSQPHQKRDQDQPGQSMLVVVVGVAPEQLLLGPS